MWDSSFELLFKQAKDAHDLEVGRLKDEVETLRRELHNAGLKDFSARSTDECMSPVGEESSDSKESSASSKDQPSTLEPSRSGSSTVAQCPTISTGDRQDSKESSVSKTLSQRGRTSDGLNTLKRRQSKEIAMQQRGFLWKFVNRPAFEMVVATMITANGVVMALEAQYAGFSLAEDTKHASALGHSSEVWPDAAAAFHVLNLFFGVFFMFEVVLRIVALRFEFVYQAWNWIDLAIALLWLASETTEQQMNAGFLRLARLARLVRLLRLVRFAQNWGVDSLFLLSTALRGSVATMGWAFATLLAIHVMLAIFLNGILREMYFDADPSKAAEQVEVFTYYGSFSRSFLTAFEISLANWPTPVRILVDNVSELFILYGVLHKTIFGFAVIAVINSVFIQETFKTAAMDDSVMVRQTVQKEKIHSEKMTRLFVEADENGDGTIDRREWENICQDEWVQLWLRSQEIKAKDAESLFEWLDNGDGYLTAEELIQGTAALKGPSAMMGIQAKLHQLDKSVGDIRGQLLAPHAAVAGAAGSSRSPLPRLQNCGARV